MTIEQDLARRDLTVNAIAIPSEALDSEGCFDPQDPRLLDPYGGRQDLRDKVLRHVTDAFHEGTRCASCAWRASLRAGRLRVAPETLELMRSMVEHGRSTIWCQSASGRSWRAV